jgi:hypothetical protein
VDEFSAGSEMDWMIQARVFGCGPGVAVPPFSTRDGTAVALADLVAARTGWKYQLVEQGGTWTAIWFEPRIGRGGVSALVSARARTRALAICRALLKAARAPRWPKREEISDARRASRLAPLTVWE